MELTCETYLAVNLGASNGRVMGVTWNGTLLGLCEVHRFCNGPVAVGSTLYWDVERLWQVIRIGIGRFTKEHEAPSSIGFDAWGVDYALLDGSGGLIRNPHHYRDSRTRSAIERFCTERDNQWLFSITGVRSMAINTVFQLAVESACGELSDAECLLMIPDYFSYLLCGEKPAEYSEASTTQFFDLGRGCWSDEVLAATSNVLSGRWLPFAFVTSLFLLWVLPINLNDVLIRQSMQSFRRVGAALPDRCGACEQ